MHGYDIAAGAGKRLEAGEEVTHRGLRGRRELRRVAQPRVEGVDVVLALGPVIVSPSHVEVHLVDPPTLDQARGKVGRAVGDDGDAVPRVLSLFAWRGAHCAGDSMPSPQSYSASRWDRSCSSLSRSACTRASGALATKPSLASLPSARAISASRRSRSLAALGLGSAWSTPVSSLDLHAAGRDRRDRFAVAVDEVQMRQPRDERSASCRRGPAGARSRAAPGLHAGLVAPRAHRLGRPRSRGRCPPRRGGRAPDSVADLRGGQQAVAPGQWPTAPR